MTRPGSERPFRPALLRAFSAIVMAASYGTPHTPGLRTWPCPCLPGPFLQSPLMRRARKVLTGASTRGKWTSPLRLSRLGRVLQPRANNGAAAPYANYGVERSFVLTALNRTVAEIEIRRRRTRAALRVSGRCKSVANAIPLFVLQVSGLGTRPDGELRKGGRDAVAAKYGTTDVDMMTCDDGSIASHGLRRSLSNCAFEGTVAPGGLRWRPPTDVTDLAPYCLIRAREDAWAGVLWCVLARLSPVPWHGTAEVVAEVKVA